MTGQDDLLDAFACTAIASRIARGVARPVPDPPVIDPSGIHNRHLGMTERQIETLAKQRAIGIKASTEGVVTMAGDKVGRGSRQNWAADCKAFYYGRLRHERDRYEKLAASARSPMS
ncbi:MAG: hypothetical protein R3D29_06405 [Nitratireductor sp.]